MPSLSNVDNIDIRPCAIVGCDGLAEAREGWCKAHYNRWVKHGDTLADIPVIRRKKDRGCSVRECDRPHKGQGLCRVHLMRLRKHGDVHEHQPIVQKTASPWLKAHAHYTGEDCLIWPFTRTLGGPGSVTGTVVGLPRRNISASRAMCILAHGLPLTPDYVAAHSCGNGHLACVNPRHLRWATTLENAADTLIHGTRRKPGREGRRTLSAKQIQAIRILADHMSATDIAEIFSAPLPMIERALGRASAHRPHLYRSDR
ncbi:hypothetical protein D3C85_933670 [compost metagenome]